MIFSNALKLRRAAVYGMVLLGVLFAWEHIASNRMRIEDDVEEILFSKESGFYEDAFFLTIRASGGDVYYTLDGSVPTVASEKYEEPIWISDATPNENVYSMRTDVSGGFYEELIAEYGVSTGYTGPGYKQPDDPVDKCVVVRAVVHYGQENYSEVKTASYFVGFDEKSGYQDMNVISIVTDPENLFGYENGIYVTGKTFDDTFYENQTNGYWAAGCWFFWVGNYNNRGEDWERQVNCQFFSSDHKIWLSQACGIRIHGGMSRGLQPKSLNLYAREEYDGNDRFRAPFFSEDCYPTRMTLFQGGNEYNVNLKDYIMQVLCADVEDVATMEFEPYVLFLDGEYWGVYWLTEKFDERYLHYHYDVDVDNVVIVKHGGLEEGEEGDLDLYNEMVGFCSSNDMTLDENFRQACEMIDVDSYIDYYAAMLYIARCGDWPGGNFALWRTRKKERGEYGDCRWRWMIFDVNSGGMSEDLAEMDSIESAMNGSAMFANLMKNDEFRARLLSRIEEFGDSIFSKDRVDTVLADFHRLMDEPMRKNTRRFLGKGKYYLYTDGVQSVTEFFEKRRGYLPEMLDAYR